MLQLEVAADGRRLEYSTHFGESGYEGTDTEHLDTPLAVAVGEGLLVYVLDAGNHRLMVLEVGERLGQLRYSHHLLLSHTASTVVQGPAFMAVSASPHPGMWLAYRVAEKGSSSSSGVMARLKLDEPVKYSLKQHMWDSGAILGLQVGLELSQGMLNPQSSPFHSRPLHLSFSSTGFPSVTLSAFPALSWDLAPRSESSPRNLVPQLCEMLVTYKKPPHAFLAPCEYISNGYSARFDGLKLFITWVFQAGVDESTTGSVVAHVPIRLPSDSGVAPNPDLYGVWEATLDVPCRTQVLVPQSPLLRSRPLSAPSPAPTLGVRPQPLIVASPLVVAPSMARLGASVVADVMLDMGTLLLGSALLPAVVRLTLPTGYRLAPTPATSPPGSAWPLPEMLACVPKTSNSCEISIPFGVKLYDGSTYSLRLEGLQTPEKLNLVEGSDEWRLAVQNSGPLRVFEGAASQSGVDFEFGLDIPKTWAFFPYVTASPLAVGLATVMMQFRPYTEFTASVAVIAPNTFRFPVQCQGFFLEPEPLGGVTCTGSGANTLVVRLSDETFNSQITYDVKFMLVHEPVTPVPTEGEELLLTNIGSWRLRYANIDGLLLAYADDVRGYPIWPQQLDFQHLEFLTRTPGPLPTISSEVLSVRFSVSVPLGRRSLSGNVSAVEIRLYAPHDFRLLCGFGNSSTTFLHVVDSQRILTSKCSELLVLSGLPRLTFTLAPPPTTPTALLPTMAPGVKYTFDAAVITPVAPVNGKNALSIERDAHTWFMSAIEVPDALDVDSPMRCGGQYFARFTVRNLQLSIATGSSVLGGLAPLWVFLVPSTIVSSPSTATSRRAHVELWAPLDQDYSFTSPCQVLPAILVDRVGQVVLPLPPGSTCSRHSIQSVHIMIPPGAVLLPGVAYAFGVQSIKMPDEVSYQTFRRRVQDVSVSANTSLEPSVELDSEIGPDDSERNALSGVPGMWQAATVTWDGVLVEKFFPDNETTSLAELVPALDEFSISPFFALTEAPRLGNEYVAAFTFTPPSMFDTPISFVMIAAPAGYSFDLHEDCSPDSTAPVNPMKLSVPEIDRAQFTAATAQLLVGWCIAMPHAYARQLLRRLIAVGSRTELLLKVSMQAALLGLPKMITDFSLQYLFRVKVRHPPKRFTEGDHTWSLSLLDSKQQLIAQKTRLAAYSLVGDLEATLLPFNRVLSGAMREERNTVAVLFRLTSHLPASGRLVLQLGRGATRNESFQFPEMSSEVGGPVQVVCDVSLTRPTGAEDPMALPLPEVADVTCSNEDLALELVLGSSAIDSNTLRVFWVTVVNPLRKPQASGIQLWRLHSYDSHGVLLDSNKEIPAFSLIDAPVPLLMLGTMPATVLSDRTAVVILFFALPAGEHLSPQSQLRVFAPLTFRYALGQACAFAEDTSTRRVSSISGSIMQVADELWSQLRPPDLKSKAARPLPPFVQCAVSNEDGREVALLTLPGRLGGGLPYIMAFNLLTPPSTPPGGRNRWRLQVWRQVNFELRLAFDDDVAGFDLVPKLREERLVPHRSEMDAFYRQSRSLPVAASVIAVRILFQLPFATDDLRSHLRVSVETPFGYEVGTTGASGGQRSCLAREVLIRQELMPPELWAACEVESKSVFHLFFQLPPEDVWTAQSIQGANGSTLLPLTFEAFPLLPPTYADNALQRWNLRVSSCNSTGPDKIDVCQLLAAATDVPSWNMYGYLHIDRLKVNYDISGAGTSDALQAWAGQHVNEWGDRKSVV